MKCTTLCNSAQRFPFSCGLPFSSSKFTQKTDVDEKISNAQRRRRREEEDKSERVENVATLSDWIFNARGKMPFLAGLVKATEL